MKKGGKQKAKGTERSKYLYRKKGYLYFRMSKTGPLVPLPPDEASPEFRRVYDKCLAERNGGGASVKRVSGKASKPAGAIENIERKERIDFLPGSVGRGVAYYLGSNNYKSKAPSTQYLYRRFCDEVREELGHVMLADLDIDGIDEYAEDVARERGASTAQQHINTLSNIWAACRKNKDFNLRGKINPTLGTDKHYSKPKRPSRPWTDEENDLFMDSAPEHLLRAHLLLHYGVQRGGDSIKMLWTDFDGVGISVRPEKLGGNALELADYQECPKPLQDYLNAVPGEERVGTILKNSYGLPWSQRNSLTAAIRNHCIAIGLREPGERGGPVPHGLRKSGATEAAETGVGGAMGVKSVSNHRSDAQANAYSAWAAKKGLNKKLVAVWNEQIAEKAERRKTEKAAKRRGKFKVVA